MLFLMILKAMCQNMYDRDLKALKRAEGFSLKQTQLMSDLFKFWQYVCLCENKTDMPGLLKHY